VSAAITLIAGLVGGNRLLAGVIAWSVIALAASGAAVGVYQLIKHQGADEVRAQIDKENQNAINKGIEASRSFRDCNDAGGLWDFRRQRCSSTSLGHR
jgi:predicted phage tail protein